MKKKPLRNSALEGLQSFFRSLPIPSSAKERIRDSAYSRLSFLLGGNPGYEDWKQLKLDGSMLASAEVSVPLSSVESIKNTLRYLPGPAFLFVTHRGGGGTETHVQDLAAKLEQEHVRVYFMRPGRNDVVELSDRSREIKLYFKLTRDRRVIVELLRSAGVAHIHVHNLLGWPSEALESIQDYASDLQVAYDFTVHDYLCFCPRFNLFDPGVKGYCGEPLVLRCNTCVSTYGSPAGEKIDVGAWRSSYSEFLGGARRVFVPAHDVGERVMKYFPHIDPVVRPHPEPRLQIRAPRSIEGWAGQRSVLVLGDLGPHKGSHVLLGCAQDAARRRLSLRFTVLGQTDLDRKLRRTGHVRVHGRYERRDLGRLIGEGDYDVALIPSVLPETYSYTLSELWQAGVHPVAFDLGAIAERIRRGGVGTLLPYEFSRDPTSVNDCLLHIEPQDFDPKALFSSGYPSYARDYYGLEGISG